MELLTRAQTNVIIPLQQKFRKVSKLILLKSDRLFCMRKSPYFAVAEAKRDRDRKQKRLTEFKP